MNVKCVGDEAVIPGRFVRVTLLLATITLSSVSPSPFRSTPAVFSGRGIQECRFGLQTLLITARTVAIPVVKNNFHIRVFTNTEFAVARQSRFQTDFLSTDSKHQQMQDLHHYLLYLVLGLRDQ